MTSFGSAGTGGMSEASENILAADIAQLRELATAAPRDAEHLVNNLKEIYRAIYFVDFARYDIEGVRAAAPRLMQEIFELRLAVRSQIPEWTARGLMTRTAQSALRDCFRASRYAGDLVGEVYLGHPRLAPGQAPQSALSGGDPVMHINPEFASTPFELKPGDVILQRGMVHNSAAIARIGDVDSQFSHLCIVARDANGTLIIVEALIEVGSTITPLAKSLGHSVGRAIVFRHRDPALAARASEFVHDYVAKTLAPVHNPVLYDFTMTLGDYKQFYCSKLVRFAFDRASEGRVLLPPFTTMLDMKNRDFLNRIGVATTETFAPGDMELATDFDVVAEWRDYRVTSELRLKDMIMTKLFEWMDIHGYKFKPDFKARAIALGGRLSSRFSKGAQELIASVTGAVVPPNMRGKTIAAVAMLHMTAEPIYKELQDLENEAIRKTGRQLHPREVFETLEKIRLRMGRRIGYLAR